MAASSNIKILTHPTSLLHVIQYPKKTSEVLAQGDLLEENGSGAEAVDSAANNVFIGIAMTGSEASDIRDIAVCIKAVIKIQMAGGQSLNFGNAATWAAGANGTDWTFTKTTTEGLVWALETIATAGSGKAMLDVVALESGIFQTVTS